jgi:hypothetical protein
VKRLLTTAFVVLFGAAIAFAQERPPIHGTVHDTTTGKPVPGVSVYNEATGEVAITDDDGRFEFLPGVDGPAKLVVVDPSYQRATARYDGEHALAIELTPVTLRGEEVVVEVERERAAAGETTLKREEIAASPGARNDALLAVKNLPGIANVPSFGPQAGLVIRGSSPQDSKIFVDGFEIPVLYHLGGIQSVLPTEMIDDIVYTPGAYGVDLGRASGGVINVASRKGAKELSGIAEVSFINAQTMLQGPLGKKGSFAFAARRSYIDALIPLVVQDSESLSFTALPRYYDYQLRADYEPVEHLKLSAFLFGSDDKLAIASDSVDPDDPAASGKFENATRFTRAILAATYDRPGRYNQLAISGLTQRVSFDVGTDRFLRVKPDSLAVRDQARVRIVDGVTLVAGAEIETRDVAVRVKLPRPPKEGDPTNPNFTYDPLVDVSQSRNQTDSGAWTAVELVPVSWFKATAGARVDDYRNNDATVVQPRVQTRTTLDDQTALLVAGGLYTRPPENADENLQTSLLPERAWQTSVGVENKIAKGLTFTTTAYYTDRSDLIVAKTDRDTAMASDGSDTYENAGVGRSYGAELLLQARGEKFFGWAAYTFARSKRTDHPMDAERVFDSDQTHNLVVLGSLKLGGRDQWRIGGRFQLTTGTPYTPVSGAVFDSDRNTYTPEYGTVNSQRNPIQHQLDLRVDRNFTFQDWKLAAYLDVANVYLNAPVYGYQYNTNYTERTEIEGIPILPSFGVRGEF